MTAVTEEARSSPNQSAGDAPGDVGRGKGRSRNAVRFLTHPEAGASLGTIVVFFFFAITAGDKGFLTVQGTGNWLTAAAQLGIGALGVGLLLIGGEFDLSIGSVLGASSICFAICVGHYGMPVAAAAAITVLMAAAIGAVNGILVLRTGLPSFLVTLATLFIVAGAALGTSRSLTGSAVISLDIQGTAHSVLAGDRNFFSVSILWWLGLAAICHYILRHTVFGNWIFATGGDVEQARAAGVRTGAVKLALFMFASVCASLVAILQTVQVQSGDVSTGASFQFNAIIAAVIGGMVITGGYGTVAGIVLGSLTFGIAQLGVFYTGWQAEWFQVILGALLLAAVVANTYLRRKAMVR